jgi:CRP-like cAMP-binding protein
MQTGARTAKVQGGDILSPDELLKFPFFKGISEKLLQKNLGAVTRRHFKKGEIICREGEQGSTAFYILSGKVDISINTAVSRIKTQPESGGWFKKITSRLVKGSPVKASRAASRFIPIDAPVDLSLDNPVAQLGPGDLFGEMTCLNFYPRSATVRAAEDCDLLEMLRNILQMLQKNKEFKALVDNAYRKHALDNQLRNVPLFRNLPNDFIDTLRSRAQLEQFEPGTVICKQGDPADAFYLIRIGHVKVSQRYPGGDMVMAYLARGQFFGEIGLLGSGERTATCTALERVEAVRIGKQDFDVMIERFPEVRAQLLEVAEQRLTTNRRQGEQLNNVFLKDFLGQSLMQAQNLLLLDMEKCTRCDDCVRACAAAHEGITRLIRQGVRYDKYLVATSCRQCRDPLCMVGCPVGSIQRQDSLEIMIQDWCIGCGLCARQCPYDNINIHEFASVEEDPESGGTKTVISKKAVLCDMCGQHDEPSCVYACPHDAARRVDPKTFFELQTIELSFPDKGQGQG